MFIFVFSLLQIHHFRSLKHKFRECSASYGLKALRGDFEMFLKPLGRRP
jgi:hypothetical protein